MILNLENQFASEQEMKFEPHVEPQPPQVPSNEDYAGPYDFDVLIGLPNAGRNTWIVSFSGRVLKKTYNEFIKSFHVFEKKL